MCEASGGYIKKECIKHYDTLSFLLWQFLRELQPKPYLL